MLSLKKILGIKKKESSRDFTNEESKRLIDAGLFEQIYKTYVTESYITDALGLAQSIETILDGIKTNNMIQKSAQSETTILIGNFKERYSSYFI